MRSKNMHGTLPAGDASGERNGQDSFRPVEGTGPACPCLARFRHEWLSRVEASGLARGEGDDADWLAARGAASLPTLPDRITTCNGRSRCLPLAASPGDAS